MSRYVMHVSVIVFVGLWAVAPVKSAMIAIENASFEAPAVDPNAFPALPFVEGWTEIDLDTEAGANTGVFGNTPEGSPDRLDNADGRQLAFLGSEQGNALEQDLMAVYQAGRAYRLTVAVGVSSMFPPSTEGSVDTLELVLYYRDDANAVDVVRQTVEATGQSSTQLQDFSVYLPPVGPGDAWAGKAIGVAIRAVGAAGGFWDLDNVRLMELLPVSIPIENASFEAPAVDPNAFPALPFVEGWIELDLDTEAGTNTGVFPNSPEGSPDRLANADGSQLAFLGSEQGNALEQDLAAVYHAGTEYRLTVAVGVSGMFPPAMEEPVDTLDLVLYYRSDANAVDIVRQTVAATGLSSTELQDFTVSLPAVQAGVPWTGKPIGVAIRATGAAGGFWDLDDVRLVESMPALNVVENASFEAPAVDPNGFPVLPFMNAWTEIDLDTEGSTNTGIFLNSPEGSPDRLVNVDGSQLAFLGSQLGNALEQDLTAVYEPGHSYRLTVGVGVSAQFPPSVELPTDTLELVLYDRVDGEVVDVAWQTIEPAGLTATRLQDFSLYLSPVQPHDPWAGKPIGIAIRAMGSAGGFWDIDNVRLAESFEEMP